MWSRGHKARGQGQRQGHKKIRVQGQPFRGQTLSRPRTAMLEAKAKDTGASVLRKKKKKRKKERKSSKFFFGRSKKFFRRSPIRTQKRNSQIFRKVSGVFQQNFNAPKTSAVLEQRTGPFSRT